MRHLHRSGSLLFATVLLVACGGHNDAPVASLPPASVPAPVPQNRTDDDLRTLAQQAAHAQRLFAPAGDNAVEYYLRLRRQHPNDPNTEAALVDLQPLLVIAAEQAIANGHYPESRRLQGLLMQVNAGAPALARLQTAVSSAEAVMLERELTVDAEAKAKALKLEAELRQKAQESAARLSVERASASTAVAIPAPPPAPAPVSKPALPASTSAVDKPQTAAAATSSFTAAPASVPPPATAATAAKVVRAEAVPRPIRQAPPRYPASAGRNGVSGQVQVAFTITPNGDVESARVLSSNLPASFERSAVFAVSRWKFEATGSSVATTTSVKFDSQSP